MSLTLATLLPTLVATTQLDSADINIDFADHHVVVTTRYHVAPNDETARFVLMRLPNQEVAWSAVPAVVIDSTDGLYEVRFGNALGTYTFSYRVTGRLARIPVMVPSVLSGSQSRSIRLTVRDPPAQLRLTDTFPRLTIKDQNELQAALDNVPSFVRLPVVGASASTNRMADASVVVLIAFASIWWLVRHRRTTQA